MITRLGTFPTIITYTSDIIEEVIRLRKLAREKGEKLSVHLRRRKMFFISKALEFPVSIKTRNKLMVLDAAILFELRVAWFAQGQVHVSEHRSADNMAISVVWLFNLNLT